MTPRIIESDGDIFDSGCTALVSPVDAVTGAQGKGLALEFKKRWPERCEAYRQECRAGRVEPGAVIVDSGAKPWILFAATKRHWREASTLSYVRACLREIAFVVRSEHISSIAIPALGCGLGGLSWSVVREDILCAVERMTPCERVVIYGSK